MDMCVLEDAVREGLSEPVIATRMGCSRATVRHWLKKYHLGTIRGPKGKHPEDWTPPCKCTCGETDPSKFYGHKRQCCAKCHLKYVSEKGKEKIAKARQLLGGKCQACGFDRFPCSLDFHHTNPAEKDPGFGTMRGWSWSRIERELKKCLLLCKNCHAAVHAGDLGV